ncbi:PREDICTED: centrosomal protein of 162 kDa-like [Acropora digitifera]|uniref:centrosomal protein of 162 kDa-like n=1 Tax=Acropora digitifera TaxID=70779 RepID=UPI000779FE72|nr:PREDICTED: centrosomal protein of 162 kDa-like [Acropora digitifera]
MQFSYGSTFNINGDASPAKSERTKREANTSASFPVPESFTGKQVSMGLETMNEQADKRNFFHDEEEGLLDVDYNKKLAEISTSESVSPDGREDERLQETGAEVGDSIFNLTGKNSHGSKSFELLLCQSTLVQYHTVHHLAAVSYSQKRFWWLEAHTFVSQILEPPVAVKPSLLSKVSLMESLDSTLETKRPAAAANLLSPPKHGQKAASATEGHSIHHSLVSGFTQDIEQTKQGQIVIEKNDQGETRSRGFDLQPVIVTDDFVGTENTSKSIAALGKERDFGLRHVKAGESGFQESFHDASYEPSSVVESSQLKLTSDTSDVHRRTAGGREFDLEPAANASGFSLQPVAEGSGLGIKSSIKSNPDSVSSIVVEERGFDLQPAQAGHGFSLQPIVNLLQGGREEVQTQGEGEDDEEDMPPEESLQSIKSIVRARKSAGRESDRKGSAANTSVKKGPKVTKEKSSKKGSPEKPPQRKEKRKSASSAVGKSNLFKPSPSSAPSWSPTPTMRDSKTKSKKPLGASKKLHLEPSPPSQPTESASSAKHLAASVESFANYLRHFVRPDSEDAEPPRARWSNDEPARSVSRSSFRRVSDEHQLSREKALQTELENWQLAWKDEKKRNDKLIADMASREKEWSRREETCRLEYESQIHELKQELFVLQTKLNDTEKEADARKKIAAGGKLECASEEELAKLEKEVREQEQLLSGYQLENERLYKELKQMQAREKANEARMFSENQRLASELANLKEKTERRESEGPSTDLPTPGSAALGADKINQLTSEMRILRRRVSEVKEEAEGLRRAKYDLEARIRAVEGERDEVARQNTRLMGSNSREATELERKYEAEVERMRGKLRWYAENQALLDRDALALKKKEEEIGELKETVARLQAQHGQTVAERKQRGTERATDAKRIQDLERQVREMEEIIKRRYPNSLPALIYAAASAPGHAQVVTADSPRKHSPTYAFLENRVKKLEVELENKDEEASKRIRCVEQKYNSLKMEYEDRIKELERDLQTANNRSQTASYSNTRVPVLEAELQTVRTENEQKIKHLETEIRVLQDALAKATAAETWGPGKTNRGRKLESEKPLNDDLNNVVHSLKEKLDERELELEELRQTCNRLKREREQMLASEGVRGDQQTSATPDPLVIELQHENNRLKEQVSTVSLDMDQQRVRFQASLAETERSARLAREEAADQVREESLQQQVTQLRLDLKRARDHFTPEMKHFDSLETKISALEHRHSQREVDLQRIIEKTHLTAKIDKEETEAKWRQVVRQKNREIEKFRFELDAILEVLSELKRQGVVIPLQNGEGFVP